MAAAHDAEIARCAGSVVVLSDGNILCDTPGADYAVSTLHSHMEAVA